MTPEPTTTKAPTARIGLRLIKNQPGRYVGIAILWSTIWVMPVIPALITRAFFDRISSDAGAGFTVPTLIALLIGYADQRRTISAAHLEAVSQELVTVVPE